MDKLLSSIFILPTFLIISFTLRVSAQSKVFKCDGIYSTTKNGWELKLAKDSTKSFLVDSVPIVCFSEFKSAHLATALNDKKPRLFIELNNYGTIKFDSATIYNIGKPLLIIFENSIIAAP